MDSRLKCVKFLQVALAFECSDRAHLAMEYGEVTRFKLYF